MKTFVFTIWDDNYETNWCISDARFETLAELESFLLKHPPDSIVKFESGSIDLGVMVEYAKSEAALIQSLDTWVESHTKTEWY